MTLTQIISSEYDKFLRRVVKFRASGKNIRTAIQVAPFGMDTSPLPGMKAVYSSTEERGKSVVIGYLNENMIAAAGEVRLYSLNDAGVLQTYLWLKKDGVLLLGGDQKHLARYEELKVGFDQLKSDFNSFLTHVHGGSGTPPTPPATPSTASVDNSKTNTIKTL